MPPKSNLLIEVATDMKWVKESYTKLCESNTSEHQEIIQKLNGLNGTGQRNKNNIFWLKVIMSGYGIILLTVTGWLFTHIAS